MPQAVVVWPQGPRGGLPSQVGEVNYAIEVTEDAFLDLKTLLPHEQAIILAGIERQLPWEPTTETRNRKPLRPNELSDWEVRIVKYRVFYDVSAEAKIVTVKAIGRKGRNTLLIRGKEFSL